MHIQLRKFDSRGVPQVQIGLGKTSLGAPSTPTQLTRLRGGYDDVPLCPALGPHMAAHVAMDEPSASSAL